MPAEGDRCGRVAPWLSRLAIRGETYVPSEVDRHGHHVERHSRRGRRIRRSAVSTRASWHRLRPRPRALGEATGPLPNVGRSEPPGRELRLRRRTHDFRIQLRPGSDPYRARQLLVRATRTGKPPGTADRYHDVRHQPGELWSERFSTARV